MHKLFFGNASQYYDEKAFNNSLSKVGEYRRKKIDALKNQKDKARSLTAGLLFAEACHAYGLDQIVDRVADDENGKPYFNCPDEAFPGNKRMYFNISHSEDYVLIGMSDAEIGVDIQYIKEIKSDIASKYFTKDEQDLYYRASDEEYQQVFFKIWCLKESYVKFKGTGLKEGLDTFSVLAHMQDCGLWHEDYVYAVTTQDYKEMDATLEAEKEAALENAAKEVKKTIKEAVKEAKEAVHEAKDAVKSAVVTGAKAVIDAVKETKEIIKETDEELKKLDTPEEKPEVKPTLVIAGKEDIITKVPDKTSHVYEIYEKNFDTQKSRDRYMDAETRKSFRMKAKCLGCK